MLARLRRPLTYANLQVRFLRAPGIGGAGQRRYVAPLALALGLTLAGPLSAHAATIEARGTTIHYAAAVGEQNFAVVQGDGSRVRFQGGRAPHFAGSGCRDEPSLPGGGVSCSTAGMTRIVIDMADGEDGLVLYSVPLPTVADTGAGNDYYESGSTSVPVSVATGDGVDGGMVSGASAPQIVDLGPGNDNYGTQSASAEVRLIGGDGNDKLSGSGDAVLIGGLGDDDLTGGDGNDLLDGGPGDDDLIGKDGNDRLTGGDGDDRLEGGRGDDWLSAGPGEDDVDAGRGNDRIDTADQHSEHSLACGQGADTLLADGRDGIALDCESVEGGTNRVGASGVVNVILSCPGGCSGRIRLSDRSGRELGSATFGGGSARAAAISSVKPVRLSNRGRRLLNARRTLRATARISARDSNGRTHVVRARYRLRRR